MAVDFDLPLDDDEEAAELAATLAELGNDSFLRTVVREGFTVHHQSTDRLLGFPLDEPDESASSLLLRALHLCFCAHLPLSLSPDLLWYTVVHEVATHVRLNSDTYAGLFTDTPGEKQTITVRDDSLLYEPNWQRSLHLIQQPLRDRIGDDVADLLQPAFSTTTPVDTSATLVALMDVVSPYYDFRWQSLCGIPRIRLEGTAQDWQLLTARVRELEGWFEGLRPWLRNLRPVLTTIVATASGEPVDQDFWRSIYKWRSASGGARVTGWITAFFAHRYLADGPQPVTGDVIQDGQFPAHLSRVPYKWERPDGIRSMTFLGGVLGIERDGDWIRPRLGFAVLELTDRPLPDAWTITDINAFTGRSDAALLPTDQLIAISADYSHQLLATRAISFGDQAVVEADGLWYPGHLFEQEFMAVRPSGSDLTAALRALPR
ncbi:DUF4419 domain-containing protein [Kitasatospora azatica]|uniref:DUF4419 domain-containing protein n=1 Tax=Kitasatospora azatica TaxID=58347 RepID=UPI00068C5149|nr:DUF4419 domain-containing protein [Kitasatospora azatica]